MASAPQWPSPGARHALRRRVAAYLLNPGPRLDADSNRLFPAPGWEGADLIDGGDDKEILVGDLVNDIIVGGNGNDDLYGGGDNDALVGQAGTDGSGGTDYCDAEPSSVARPEPSEGSVHRRPADSRPRAEIFPGLPATHGWRANNASRRRLRESRSSHGSRITGPLPLLASHGTRRKVRRHRASRGDHRCIVPYHSALDRKRSRASNRHRQEIQSCPGLPEGTSGDSNVQTAWRASHVFHKVHELHVTGASGEIRASPISSGLLICTG